MSPIQLTLPELTRLHEKLDVALDSKKEDLNSTVNLSRFGLKTPHDIKVFLLSPAGETVKGEIGAELAAEKALLEEQQLEQQEEAIRRQRLYALLFLWLMEEEGQANSVQSQLIELINEKRIKDSKNSANPEQKTAYDLNQSLKTTLIQYDVAIKAHQEQQRQLEATEKALHEQLNTLEQEGILLAEKHTIYQEFLDQFETLSTQHEALNEEDLGKEMQQLEQQVHAHSEEIMKHLDQDREKEARELLNRQHILNLKLAGLRHILLKRRDENEFVDAEGKAVASHKDAVYILAKGQTIIEMNGKHYLLNAGKTWDDIKDKPEEQNEAQTHFERSKHELMNTKTAILHIKKLEMESHKIRIDETRIKIETNKTERLTLANQITLLQAARANVEASIQQPGLAMKPSPMPSSSSKPTATAPTPSPQMVKSALIAFCKEIQQTPKLTFGQLCEGMKKIPNSIEKAALEQDLKKKQPNLTEIARTTPVPQQIMTSLLQNLARLGINAYKPGVTNTPSPLQQQEPPKTETPTPFKITPSPYNKH